MRKLFIRPLAIIDLENIWAYSQKEWGADQADQYLKRIDEELKRIAAEPEAGRSAESIRAGYRMHRIGRHYVFFVSTTTTVSIRRVLHERMDFPRHL